MTDPRIEAAAKAIAEYVYERAGKPLKWEDMGDTRQNVARDYASVGLAAADAEAWRTLADQPPSERVLIMSRHGAAVAQWDAKIDGWRNEDTMYSPRYFTHWQPLPAPPLNEVQG